MNGFAAVAGFAILLVRPGMLVLATPFLGSMQSPTTMRVGLTVILAFVMAPFATMPDAVSLTTLTVVIVREMGIGLALALSIRLLVLGAEFAGHYTGLQVGLSMGALIDPQTGVRNNMLAMLYAGCATLICFGFNLHHMLLRALADSYLALPIGLGGVSGSLTGSVASLLGLVLVLGVRIAAPVIVALLIVELSLGLLTKVAPALNVMIAGLPVRLAVGLLIAAVTVTLLPSILSRYASLAVDLARATAEAFR
jgi:flagellar biosynthetic protein FliR